MRTHGPLHVDVFVEPMFQENAYLLWADAGPDAWIVDPGLPPHSDNIAAALRAGRLVPRSVLLTHAHVDHIAGVVALCQAFPELKLWAPRAEQHMLTDPVANLSAPFGCEVVTPPADRLIAPGDQLNLGSLAWFALDVSGHSPGGTAYYCPAASIVLSGDALFAGNIGRTDFPDGSEARLLSNIRRNLFALPPETVLYSGHGPSSTIGEERDTNPHFVGDAEE